MLKNQKKIGVIISYLGQIVHILTGLIYTPVMLRLLGQSEYGLYQLVHSVVSYLSLLSLGFGSSYIRFFAREKAKNNDDGIAKLNGMFLIIFLTMSVICILCGVVLVCNIRSVFSDGLTDLEYHKAKILMIIMIVNMALTFPNSVFNCIITSHEKFLFQKTLLLFHYLLNPFLTLPLLLMGYGSVGMVLVSTGITMCVLILNIAFCFLKLNTRFNFRGMKISLLMEMGVFTFFIFLSQIVDQVNWSVDKYLLGRFSGTVIVAIYSIGAQINTLYLQFSTSVSNVFIPQVNRVVADSKKWDELSRIFIRVGRVQFMIMSLILSGFFYFGKEFIRFWAGTGYEESYVVTLLLIVPVTVPLTQNMGIEIQRAMNKHRTRSIVYFFIAIANIFISIPLIKIKGAIGAAIGTAISLTMGNIVFMNWYYYKKLNIDIPMFWKQILKFAPAILISFPFGLFCKIIINNKPVWCLCIGLFAYSVIYSLALYYTVMNEEEKCWIKIPFNIINNKIMGKNNK